MPKNHFLLLNKNSQKYRKCPALAPPGQSAGDLGVCLLDKLDNVPGHEVGLVVHNQMARPWDTAGRHRTFTKFKIQIQIARCHFSSPQLQKLYIFFSRQQNIQYNCTSLSTCC